MLYSSSLFESTSASINCCLLFGRSKCKDFYWAFPVTKALSKGEDANVGLLPVAD